MSKKVGIITQHRVVNYGSVLQTYALQEKSKIWATDGTEWENGKLL